MAIFVRAQDSQIFKEQTPGKITLKMSFCTNQFRRMSEEEESNYRWLNISQDIHQNHTNLGNCFSLPFIVTDNDGKIHKGEWVIGKNRDPSAFGPGPVPGSFINDIMEIQFPGSIINNIVNIKMKNIKGGHINPDGPMGPSGPMMGPDMGPSGPMGPGGPMMGPSGPMGPGGPMMGPGMGP